MEYTDQLQRKISLSDVPRRIISLVPSQTELLVDLDLRDHIVGLTKFCVHPQELRSEKTVVGGTKKVSFSKIKNLKPDIILCNKEENTEEMVAGLHKIAPVWVSDVATVKDCQLMIQAFGEIFQKEDRAFKRNQAMEKELLSHKEFISGRPPIKVIYLIWNNPLMTVGKDTFINHLLELNRLENVITKTRYPEVSPADLKKADRILLSSEPYPFKEKHIREISGLAGGVPVSLVDGEFFSWYGSRLIHAFKYFKEFRKAIED